MTMSIGQHVSQYLDIEGLGSIWNRKKEKIQQFPKSLLQACPEVVESQLPQDPLSRSFSERLLSEGSVGQDAGITLATPCQAPTHPTPRSEERFVRPEIIVELEIF